MNFLQKLVPFTGDQPATGIGRSEQIVKTAMGSPTSLLRSIIEEFRPDLEPYEDTYKDFHRHPELGRQEKRTAAIAAAHLREAGYEVVENIGGYGVTGTLKNGKGPTVLLRADMDALPIRETTGLPYASTVTAIDPDGVKTPVMHACGHDMHVTSMMACSTLMAKAKKRWQGTVIVLFQPDEEHGAGARAMLDDGLYRKIPKPDIVLAQHLVAIKTGVLQLRAGEFYASADAFKVTMFGHGAHGARPQDAIDPIVLAASTIMRLQTIVARELSPEDIASVTCASIHGGEVHNVIPSQVEFLISIRAFDENVRQKVIAAAKRIIKGEAIASGVEKEPEIKEFLKYPLTINDPDSSVKLMDAFTSYFDKDHSWEAARNSSSEDVSYFATDIGVPAIYWNFGGVDPKKWEEHQKDPKNHPLAGSHQADYAPVIQPTMKTATDAMSLAALTFLNVPRDV